LTERPDAAPEHQAPGPPRFESATGMTFHACPELHRRTPSGVGLIRKHRAQCGPGASLYRHTLPYLRSLPASPVRVAGCVGSSLMEAPLDPILPGCKPETSIRVRWHDRAVSRLVDWHGAYRQGENPARWRGILENRFAEESRGPAGSSIRQRPALRRPTNKLADFPIFVALRARGRSCPRVVNLRS